MYAAAVSSAVRRRPVSAPSLTVPPAAAPQEAHSLEQVCGGSSVFPSAEKTENMLMNLLLPLCLRVGCGRSGERARCPGDLTEPKLMLYLSERARCPGALTEPKLMLYLSERARCPGDLTESKLMLYLINVILRSEHASGLL